MISRAHSRGSDLTVCGKHFNVIRATLAVDIEDIDGHVFGFSGRGIELDERGFLV
jgi:hypothetical protein